MPHEDLVKAGAEYVRCVQEKCPNISKEKAAQYAARHLARAAQKRGLGQLPRLYPWGVTAEEASVQSGATYNVPPGMIGAHDEQGAFYVDHVKDQMVPYAKCLIEKHGMSKEDAAKCAVKKFGWYLGAGKHEHGASGLGH